MDPGADALWDRLSHQRLPHYHRTACWHACSLGLAAPPCDSPLCPAPMSHPPCRHPLGESTKFAALLINRWCLLAPLGEAFRGAGALDSLLCVLRRQLRAAATAVGSEGAATPCTLHSEVSAYSLSALGILGQEDLPRIRYAGALASSLLLVHGAARRASRISRPSASSLMLGASYQGPKRRIAGRAHHLGFIPLPPGTQGAAGGVREQPGGRDARSHRVRALLPGHGVCPRPALGSAGRYARQGHAEWRERLAP